MNIYMCASQSIRSAMVSSQLDAFLESMAGECDEKALRAIKANEIFYTVCTFIYIYICMVYICV